ncbi:hypothetical protein G7Y89_g6922 [Cudoniella acicularis]|uniref:Amidohydrolase-related domain-containing protein n=1 Tax=Cudoniella acicularis TaxID=354080 RepID=A0A8H4RLS0_9HELO|nr:hypothetical protein G7Y89_g6922 [Cudoniella acicularis]
MASKHLITPWKPEPPKSYIFLNANVVCTTKGTILPNRTVKISQGLVESVTKTDQDYVIVAKENEITIDLEGKFLCPGLIDNHVHIAAVPGETNLRDLTLLDRDVSLIRQPYVCQQILRRGFTSVRDCGGASLALKEAINDGLIEGPRLFIAGHALSQTGGHGDTRGSHNHGDCCGGSVMSLGRVCDGVAECTRAAREELRTGADFIKIMAGGGVASPTDRLDSVQFSADEIHAISTVAKNSNTYVTAHAYTPRSIRQAIDNGVTGIEHGNLIDEETARYMAEKDVFLTPTLITYGALSSPEFLGFLPVESVEKNEAVLAAGLRSLQLAFDAGVTICYGTDLLGPMTILQTREFAIRSQVLSAKDILQSATINPARRFGLADFLGQVKPGFAADLLILKENPLENIWVFDDPEKQLLAVIKEGRVFHSRWSKLAQDLTKPVPVIE